MTPQEAIRYIEDQGWSKTRMGLSRTRELLQRLGEPQKQLKFIHVAGSNGKGSTCAMLEAVLREAGYKTGLYISPYIQDFCERIQINGIHIPGETLAALTEEVRSAAEAMEDHPSQFELVTAIGLLYFSREHCDIVVLEVGMGGELDSTNVIDAPELAIIANIGLEHTEYLGSTLEEIAATKGGIIKTGCDCVCYDGASEVTGVIRRICGERHVPLHCVDSSQMRCEHADLSGQQILWQGRPYRLNLLGEHQLHNAATVFTALSVLRQRGWQIPEAAVTRGLDRVFWPARLEVLGRHPAFILDGGHNPQCAEAIAGSIRALLPGQKCVFLVGVLADKDYTLMFRSVMPLAREFICLTPSSERALRAEETAECLTALGAKAHAIPEADQAIRAALRAAGPDGAVVAFGSLYLAGQIRTAYPAARRDWEAEQVQ
jgi:dihydrofolate synthase/folylpolyglutamate synthase